MSSSTLIALEMLITLGVCVGFGVHQLLDLRRAKAETAKKEAETQADVPPAAGDAGTGLRG